MEVLVPFSTECPKSRLSTVLDPAERATFARAMLSDVLDAVAAAGGEP
ncbi:2-phospho-L-lactate guanylyltransferase, partial [Halorubrum pallidum]